MEYREPEYNPVTGEEFEKGCFMMANNTPDGLCDPIQAVLVALRSGDEGRGRGSELEICQGEVQGW